MDRFGEIAGAFNLAQQVSAAWQGKAVQGEAERARNTGWMPFNIFDFATLLLEAQAWLGDDGRKLLEIGAGPGPCLEVARALGWDTYGVEVSDQMAAAARERYLQVLTMDAMLYKAYGNYDAVWFNRVCRDRPLQMALEQKVWHDMRPGAVIICANLENPPPPSWFIINDSWGTEPEGLRRGVWAKPG